MTIGFIILRHVNSELSDYYWKESYKCIRKFYDNPILIIDDSSNRTFLNENIDLLNCTVIYDTIHKGTGEILPYYYFHKIRPFDTAVIIHDSMFIQSKIDFSLNSNENVRFLWSFRNWMDEPGFILDLLKIIDIDNELHIFYNDKKKWKGCFGFASIINWIFLDIVNKKYRIFELLLPHIKCRQDRCALERIFALLFYYFDPNIKDELFGDIHFYIQWGIKYTEYLTRDYSQYPIMKVWTAR
jgi:hypothetical protein